MSDPIKPREKYTGQVGGQPTPPPAPPRRDRTVIDASGIRPGTVHMPNDPSSAGVRVVPNAQVHVPPGTNVVDMRGNLHPMVRALLGRVTPMSPAPVPPMNRSPLAHPGLHRMPSGLMVEDAPAHQLPPTSVPVPASAQSVPFAPNPTTDRGNRIEPGADWQAAVWAALQSGQISLEDAQRLLVQAQVPAQPGNR